MSQRSEKAAVAGAGVVKHLAVGYIEFGNIPLRQKGVHALFRVAASSNQIIPKSVASSKCESIESRYRTQLEARHSSLLKTYYF